MYYIKRCKQGFITLLLIITTCIAFYGLGCGGKSSTDDADTTAPGVSEVTPVDRTTINNSASIVIKFSETMDASSLTLGGTLASASDGGAWAMTTYENDTLTIRPQANWPIGSGTLTVAVNDVAGNPLPTASAGKQTTSYSLIYGVQTFYVKQGAAGDGTMDNAMGNINDAIAAAKANLDNNTWQSSATVEVATGTYEVSSGTNHIVMREGISLYGGFSDTDWTVRDPSANTTTIKDTSTSGGTEANPHRAIEAGSGITSATVIDGFTIEGGSVGSSDCSSAIFNSSGASPTISNNIIDGGDAGGRSIGIYNNSSSVTIHDNTINGGKGEYSDGIYNYSGSSSTIYNNAIYGEGVAGGKASIGIHNDVSSPTIYNNTIQGGASGDLTVGIYSGSSSPSIYNNVIHGGGGSKNSVAIYNETNSSPSIYSNAIDGGSGGGATADSCGIYNDSSCSPSIYNNTIDGGDNGSSYGIRNNKNSSPSIYNNTIYAGDADCEGIENDLNSTPKINNNIIFSAGGAAKIGIAEKDAGSDPIEVKNNDVLDCPKALYDDWTQGYLPVVCSGGTYGDVGCAKLIDPPTIASGNISIDPSFVDKAGGDWHLTSSSPTAVTQGGLDGSAEGWGFTTDKDGNTRTAPWSMGAYEYD